MLTLHGNARPQKPFEYIKVANTLLLRLGRLAALQPLADCSIITFNGSRGLVGTQILSVPILPQLYWNHCVKGEMVFTVLIVYYEHID